MKIQTQFKIALRGLIADLMCSLPVDAHEAQRVLAAAFAREDVIRFLRASAAMAEMDDVLKTVKKEGRYGYEMGC